MIRGVVFIAIGMMALNAGMAQMKNTARGGHEMKGYLVDRMCAKSMVKQPPEKAMRKAKNHTRECCFHDECAASGFGLMSGGTFYPFDEAGNARALKLLKSIKKENDIEVVVTGTHDGDTIKVEKVVMK